MAFRKQDWLGTAPDFGSIEEPRAPEKANQSPDRNLRSCGKIKKHQCGLQAGRHESARLLQDQDSPWQSTGLGGQAAGGHCLRDRMTDPGDGGSVPACGDLGISLKAKRVCKGVSAATARGAQQQTAAEGSGPAESHISGVFAVSVLAVQ